MERTTPATVDPWVVLRAQAGDREALDRVLRAIQSRLFAYVLRIVRNRSDAEDVLQDVFVQIVRKLKWLRNAEWFLPWAYRIATRAALRTRKAAGGRALRTTAFEEDLPAPAPEDVDILLRRALPATIDELPPGSQAVIVMHYLEDRPLAEVATVLDIPLGTVKSRLAYGLERMRATLAPRRPMANDAAGSGTPDSNTSTGTARRGAPAPRRNAR